MTLSSALWDRLAYHALMPLAAAVARCRGVSVERLALGTGVAATEARLELAWAMVTRAGWPHDAAVELVTGEALGMAPVADVRPRAVTCYAFAVTVLRNTVTVPVVAVTPATMPAGAPATSEAAAWSAAECSERWAA